ncbi:hypothetical protein ASPFODRAFT_490617 [Aspergillus luchuensis CBS 106.47]|uniref:Uncharacterized protein n=1 Tax=Aspergillus luchuensis (strain CBS 106.47) TaxID=1137211 RepID=A0A1M3TRM2_ASPLC|nr:hypothetical protein ASPFODRAFT_490617 [Aspergillus luchuensis CBS 106.47]
MVYEHTPLGYHCTCHRHQKHQKHPPLLSRSVCARLSPSCLLVLVSRQARYFSCNLYFTYHTLCSLLFSSFSDLCLFSPIHPFLSISAFFLQCGFSDPSTHSLSVLSCNTVRIITKIARVIVMDGSTPPQTQRIILTRGCFNPW